MLEPLDTISWPSARNGYAGKLFEVAAITDTLMTARQYLSIRECDPVDYIVAPADILPLTVSPPGALVPGAQTVIGFDLLAFTITEASGGSRRPALKLIWDPAAQDNLRGLDYEVRVAATAVVIERGSISNVAAGEVIVAAAILSGVGYEARMLPVADWPTAWTAWEAVTAPGLLIDAGDILRGAISKLALLRYSGSSFDVTADAAGSAQILLPEQAVAFDAGISNGAGGYQNPLLVTINLRCQAVTAVASLQFRLMGYWSGVWQVLDTSVPFHVLHSAFGTETHFASYQHLLDYYDPSTPTKVRLDGHVNPNAPHSSHQVQIDTLMMTLQQINR